MHRVDAARVYRLALENGAGADRYHAVAEEGVAFKDIPAVIGHRLNTLLAGKKPEEATAHFGWFAQFAAMDREASSERTRKLLGGEPNQPGLIADLENGRYFETQADGVSA